MRKKCIEKRHRRKEEKRGQVLTEPLRLHGHLEVESLGKELNLNYNARILLNLQKSSAHRLGDVGKPWGPGALNA